MRFAKYHGIGNDFVLIADPEDQIVITAELAARLCDRRFGVGADGVIRVAPGRDGADLFMDYINSDGTLGEMCGNGIRCFAKYVYEYGLTQNKELEVETLAGIIRPRIVGDLVEVDMGEPILEGRKIPVDADGQIVNRPLIVDSRTYTVTCVSMGNPHCVIYLDDIESLDLKKVGPGFEHHAFFPKRVNTEFIKLLSPNEVNMRVWERGAGETWACGTGASAVAVAGVLGGKTERKLTVHLKGGDLFIEWRHNNRVYMTGAAEEVFQGRVNVN